MPTIKSIYRYPVKGLTAQLLGGADLTKNQSLAFDRFWAVENGTSDFDTENPKFMPKRKFLQICANPKVALFDCKFDESTQTLTLKIEGNEPISASLATKEGRKSIETFLALHVPAQLDGPPRIVSAQKHNFSDIREDAISIINLASVEDLSRIMGQKIDPLRFRGNIYIEGLEPWQEMDWVGKTMTVNSEPLLDIFAVTGRCLATHVDLKTGERDLTLLDEMNKTLGHTKCGLYAMVKHGGHLKTADKIGIA